MKKTIISAITLSLTIGTGLAAPKPATNSPAGNQGVLEIFENAAPLAEDFTTGESLSFDAPLNDQSGGKGWQNAWSGNEAFIVGELEKGPRSGGDKLSFAAAAKASTPGTRKTKTFTIQRQLKAPIGKATETWVEFYIYSNSRATAGVGLVDAEGKLLVAASKDHGSYEEINGPKKTGFLRLFDANGPTGQNVSAPEDKALAYALRWNKVLLRIKGDGKGQAVAQAWVNPNDSSTVSEPACSLDFAESADIAGVQLRAVDFYDNAPGEVQITGLTIKTIP